MPTQASKELGHNLLVSQAFASAATRNHDHLRALGSHRLRGVARETELFGPAD